MPPAAGRKGPTIPSHFAPSAGAFSTEEEGEEESPRTGRPCYVFNPILKRNLDDTACEHCRFYLTSRCPHLEEFMEDLEEMSPEG
ncbi:MAG: hypothetical protein KGJ23_00740 [Euryarchaeota archaeon]|nr:hypothetical protein [Euryarchaeota archaeon]MDE1835122.1 hypothetical protein [Euryarchaeota archaeon]MDE1880692.1 hypothetical protein [Euryarchaeota archaeon]MDE2044915.1 hypothetical protein [Thermoplasmata archaeon]